MPGRRSSAEEQVACDVQGGGHGEGLVDGFDARGAGIHRGAEVHRLAVQPDLAGVGGHRSGERFDQGGLAGPVVADDGEYLAGVEVEVDAIETDDPAEGFDQAAGPQDRLPGVYRCGAEMFDGCGHGYAFTFRIHWSMDTATMIRTPVARTRHWSSTPASDSPLRNT